MAIKHFGHVDGQPPGTTYANRDELAASGVHPPPRSGIHGTKKDGADSVVASGGYPDDEDHGDYLIYTGAGGNDPLTKSQIEHQTVDHYNNAGLITSELNGYPVRVTRGARADSTFAPSTGLRYDGLFAVTRHWTKPGVDGYQVVMFRLDKLSDDTPEAGPGGTTDLPQYATALVTRRSSPLTWCTGSDPSSLWVRPLGLAH